MVLLPLFMLVAPSLIPILPVRGRDVSVPLVPLSSVPEVVLVPVVFSIVEVVPGAPVVPELFVSLEALPESTEPELLLVLLWVVVDFFVVVVFLCSGTFRFVSGRLRISAGGQTSQNQCCKKGFFHGRIFF
jgi:hypothetical protein